MPSIATVQLSIHSVDTYTHNPLMPAHFSASVFLHDSTPSISISERSEINLIFVPRCLL